MSMRWKLLLMCVLLGAVAASAGAATRTASGSGTLSMLWFGNNGAGSFPVVLPFVYPMSTAVTATYSSSYDARTGRYNVTLQKLDEYVSVTNGTYGPCQISAGVSTNVLQNRTTSVLTVTRSSSGSTRNAYWTNPGTLIDGFTNTRWYTVTNPRLQTTASAAGYACTGWRNLTTTIDLP